MTSVPVQIGASIHDGGCLTHAQSQVAVVFIVSFERYSVDRWKRYRNASVDENILLRFRRDENGHFWKLISVVGAWMLILESGVMDSILVKLPVVRWMFCYVFQKHRVLIPEKELKKRIVRRSLAFFGHPDNEVMIECLDGSNKYPPITSMGYLQQRFAATYWTAITVWDRIGSLSKDNGDGNKNVTWKYNFILFVQLRDYFNSLNLWKNNELTSNLISRGGVRVNKENETFPVVCFTFSAKPWIWSFHAVVLKRTAKKCTKI